MDAQSVLSRSEELGACYGQSPTLIEGVNPILWLPQRGMLQAVETLQNKRLRVRQKQTAIRFQTAVTELDLAITFYLVAAATKNQNTSDRATANAQRAYAVAAASLDCTLEPGQNLEVEEKLIRLNAARAGTPNALFVC